MYEEHPFPGFAGAERGLRVSQRSLAEGRRLDGGVTYYQHDLLEGPPPPPPFRPSVVVAAWLLPYASNFNELLEFCEAAAVNLESGGRFVARGVMGRGAFTTSRRRVDGVGEHRSESRRSIPT